MNLSPLGGLVYLALLALIPSAGLRVVWRRTRPGSPGFAQCLLAVPLFAFLVGGARFAVPDGLSRGPNVPDTAISVWGVFVIAGTFSIGYCVAGLIVVGIVLVLWRVAHPASFTRLTRRRNRPGRM
jgi:hypothetical protein